MQLQQNSYCVGIQHLLQHKPQVLEQKLHFNKVLGLLEYIFR